MVIVHENMTEKTFSSKLLVSILSIVVCTAILCMSTFAWFTAATKATGNIVSTATYTLSVAHSSNMIDISDPYKCSVDGTYTFTLDANGTAKTGYCKIIVNEDVSDKEKIYYTTIIDRDDSNLYSISMVAVAGTTIKFVPQWGDPEDYIPEIGLYTSGSVIEHSVIPTQQIMSVDVLQNEESDSEEIRETLEQTVEPDIEPETTPVQEPVVEDVPVEA